MRTKTRTQLGVALLAGLTLASVACSGTDGELLIAPSDASSATDATFDATGEMDRSDGGHDGVGAVDAADEERASRPDAEQADGADAEVAETSTPVDASTDGEGVADAVIDEGTPDEGTTDGGALDASDASDASDATVSDAGDGDAGAPDANLDAASTDASDAAPADAGGEAATDASDASPADAGDAGGDSGVACNRPEDCPGTDTGCAWRVCDQKQCAMAYVPMDDLSATQTPGDCNDAVCDGFGNQSNLVDSNDVPIDGDPCTSDVCTAGIPSNPPAPDGTSCGGGGHVCSGGVCGPRACDAGGPASSCN